MFENQNNFFAFKRKILNKLKHYTKYLASFFWYYEDQRKVCSSCPEILWVKLVRTFFAAESVFLDPGKSENKIDMESENWEGELV